jgi:hypothetical protein
MSQRTKTLWAGGIVTGCVALAWVLLPASLRGHDARKASPPGKLVVHEWGTFTSFAGSDGVNLEFRPLVTNDLPPFIQTLASHFVGLFTKQQVYALQRMETPVTYFYTDVPRFVNVRVDFPRGMLTEWYPVVKHFDSGNPSLETPQGYAYLDWGGVRLTPPAQFAHVRVRDSKGQAVSASLPPVAADDHYGRARETDSAIVETVEEFRGSHFEKFLFYRGVGNFELPVKLVALGNDRFAITNAGDDVSGALLLVRIDNNRVRFTRIDPISPRATIAIDLPRAESTVERLAAAMIRELTAAGLYGKEALAMVNTWRTSWFGENGTRLLYLVPEKLTDTLLPLAVNPAPDERVRVLVGRLETLTPEDCERLIRALTGAGPDERPAADLVEAELAALGRFAEPALQFVIGQTADVPTRSRLEAILAEVRGGK